MKTLILLGISFIIHFFTSFCVFATSYVKTRKRQNMGKDITAFIGTSALVASPCYVGVRFLDCFEFDLRGVLTDFTFLNGLNCGARG